MKKIIIIYVALIIAVILLTIFRGSVLHMFGLNKSTATINGKQFNLILAKTQDEQVTGLSGRNSLDPDTGMLFIFPTKDTYNFWMKDMKFPIDIIYINDNKVVDDIENAPIPTTTDTSQLPIYHPREAANYVLEINAGLSKKYNIKIGDTITFSNL